MYDKVKYFNYALEKRTQTNKNTKEEKQKKRSQTRIKEHKQEEKQKKTLYSGSPKLR